jgi:hypothetical protein
VQAWQCRSELDFIDRVKRHLVLAYSLDSCINL